MEEILKICGVSKSFKSFQLKNINLNIKENCITGFLGKNGAGKTTLIKIILGLIHKDEGNIIYFNNPALSPKNIKDQIGVVLDEGYFYDNLTLKQMKNLVASTFTNWDNKKYESYLKRFRLDGKQTISTLSKGMKMKYADGTIVKVTTAVPETMKKNNSKWAVISYKVDGKINTSENRIQVSMNQKVGDKIKIAYYKDNPAKLFTATIKRGLLFLIVALLSFLVAYKMR